MKPAMLLLGAAFVAAGMAACATASPRSAERPITVRSQAQTQAQTPAPVVLRSEGRFQKEYVLAPDDQVEVVVQRVPEVSRSVLIRPDGRLSLPLLDDVQAAGLTISQLDAKLTELFSARLVAPEVTVIGLRLRPPMVFVSGEVTSPSAIPLRDAPRAADAIARAGGFKRSASVKEVTIVRLRADGHLEAVVIGRPGESETVSMTALALVTLEPDDIILVPESDRSRYTRFVDDFVNRPLTGLSLVLNSYMSWFILRGL